MEDTEKTREQLIEELVELRRRVRELEEAAASQAEAGKSIALALERVRYEIGHMGEYVNEMLTNGIPMLLAGDREDEIGVGLGEEEELLQSGAVTAAENAAAADRNQALIALPARRGDRFRIEKRPDPGQPVG